MAITAIVMLLSFKLITGNLQLFSFIPTPMSGNEKIGVVGYPLDRSLSCDDDSNELGAQMYADFKLTTYDRLPEALNRLRYTISTYAGWSFVFHQHSTRY